MDREMRRKDRLISNEECMEALQVAEYGTLATISEDGTPYITPMNFAYSDGALYFHCAKDAGHKLENVAYSKNACFNVVDSVKLIPEKFATKYRSVTVFGEIEVVEDPKEKRNGISSIALKLSPDYVEEGNRYIDTAIDQISMLKLKINRITGKASK